MCAIAVATQAGLRLLVVVANDEDSRPGEVVSALECAEIRALASMVCPQRKVSRRVGINRRTVARTLASTVPPRCVPVHAGRSSHGYGVG